MSVVTKVYPQSSAFIPHVFEKRLGRRNSIIPFFSVTYSNPAQNRFCFRYVCSCGYFKLVSFEVNHAHVFHAVFYSLVARPHKIRQQSPYQSSNDKKPIASTPLQDLGHCYVRRR